MGAYVKRDGKEYYKADNGKLYQDYNAAASANMNPVARVTRFATDRIKDITNEGAIPVPSGNNLGYSALGYAKSLAGIFGMPFSIQKNPETERFLQQTVDASTKTGNTATFNDDIKDKDEYKRLGSDIGNKAFGRYEGPIEPNGDVTVQDNYDTNRGIGWHGKRALTGKSKEGDSIGLSGRAISAISAYHKALDTVGLTNSRPYGREVTIGNVNGAPEVQPQTKRPAQIPSQSTPSSDSYAVQAGDTLTDIARGRGMSVADIAKLNGIADINQIGVGQSLRFN